MIDCLIAIPFCKGFLIVGLVSRSEIPVVGNGDNERQHHKAGSQKERERYPTGAHAGLGGKETVVQEYMEQQNGILQQRLQRVQFHHLAETLATVVTAYQGSISEEDGEQQENSRSDEPHGPREPAKEDEERQHQLHADAEACQNEAYVQREEAERENVKLELVDCRRHQLTHRRENKHGGNREPKDPAEYFDAYSKGGN